jgi:hypothetical protein
MKAGSYRRRTRGLIGPLVTLRVMQVACEPIALAG